MALVTHRLESPEYVNEFTPASAPDCPPALTADPPIDITSGDFNAPLPQCPHDQAVAAFATINRLDTPFALMCTCPPLASQLSRTPDCDAATPRSLLNLAPVAASTHPPAYPVAQLGAAPAGLISAAAATFTRANATGVHPNADSDHTVYHLPFEPTANHEASSPPLLPSPSVSPAFRTPFHAAPTLADYRRADARPDACPGHSADAHAFAVPDLADGNHYFCDNAATPDAAPFLRPLATTSHTVDFVRNLASKPPEGFLTAAIILRIFLAAPTIAALAGQVVSRTLAPPRPFVRTNGASGQTSRLARRRRFVS